VANDCKTVRCGHDSDFEVVSERCCPRSTDTMRERDAVPDGDQRVLQAVPLPHVVVRIVSGHQGDAEAAAKLWERYCTQMLQIARRRMASSHLRLGDEEDVVLSAFDSLFERAKRGAFAQTSENGLGRQMRRGPATHASAGRAGTNGSCSRGKRPVAREISLKAAVSVAQRPTSFLKAFTEVPQG